MAIEATIGGVAGTETQNALPEINEVCSLHCLLSSNYAILSGGWLSLFPMKLPTSTVFAPEQYRRLTLGYWFRNIYWHLHLIFR